MDTQIQVQKLNFLEEFMRVNDAEIISKLSDVLRHERAKRIRARLQPMVSEALDEKLNRSEEALAEGRTLTQAEVEAYFQNRRRTD
jgi:hypothetical protein